MVQFHPLYAYEDFHRGLPPLQRLLIYAPGEGDPVIHEVVELGKRLEVVTLDLTAQPGEILRQVESMATRVREMLPLAGSGLSLPGTPASPAVF